MSLMCKRSNNLMHSFQLFFTLVFHLQINCLLIYFFFIAGCSKLNLNRFSVILKTSNAIEVFQLFTMVSQ